MSVMNIGTLHCQKIAALSKLAPKWTPQPIRGTRKLAFEKSESVLKILINSNVSEQGAKTREIENLSLWGAFGNRDRS